MNDTFLISKTFIDENKIIQGLEQIATNYEVRFVISENRPDYKEIQFFVEEARDYWVFSLGGKDYFNRTKNEETTLQGYGIFASIDYDNEAPFLIDILKDLLDKFPELVLYDETAGGATVSSPHIFKREDLEQFSGKDVYAFLSKPPSKTDKPFKS